MKPVAGQLRVWIHGEGSLKRRGAPFLVIEVIKDEIRDCTRVLESGRVYSVWTRTVEVESETDFEAR